MILTIICLIRIYRTFLFFCLSINFPYFLICKQKTKNQEKIQIIQTLIVCTTICYIFCTLEQEKPLKSFLAKLDVCNKKQVAQFDDIDNSVVVTNTFKAIILPIILFNTCKVQKQTKIVMLRLFRLEASLSQHFGLPLMYDQTCV